MSPQCLILFIALGCRGPVWAATHKNGDIEMKPSITVDTILRISSGRMDVPVSWRTGRPCTAGELLGSADRPWQFLESDNRGPDSPYERKVSQ